MHSKDNSKNKSHNPDSINQGYSAPPNNPLQNPAYNPGESPSDKAKNLNGAIDYSDPSSPPPPIVVEIEEKFANIPADSQPPIMSQPNPGNTVVNWDDPKPNAGDHHAKGLFVVGMSISVVIIVGLAGFLVSGSFKKTKNINSSQKGSTTAQASNKSSTNYNSTDSTDTTDTTDYSDTTNTTDTTDYSDPSSPTYSNDGADSSDPATSKNIDGGISPDESFDDSGDPGDGTLYTDPPTAGNTPLERNTAGSMPTNSNTKVPKEKIDVEEKDVLS